MAMQPTPASKRLKTVTPVAKPDPDDEMMVCEICETPMRRGDSFSFLLSWGTTGPVPIPAFQCGGGHYGTGQHFTCSRACAIDAARACIDEHLTPEHDRQYQGVLNHPDAHPDNQAKWAQHAAKYAPHPDHVAASEPVE